MSNQETAWIASQLLAKAGLVLVPGNPTEQQCGSGAKVGQVSAAVARRIYLAMIAADHEMPR